MQSQKLWDNKNNGLHKIISVGLKISALILSGAAIVLLLMGVDFHLWLTFVALYLVLLSFGPPAALRQSLKSFLDAYVRVLPRPGVLYPIIGITGWVILCFLLPDIHNGTASIWELLIKELAFAMIVAASIAGTVEVYAQRRHDIAKQQLQKDVFGAVYENRLSKNIFSTVREHILDSRFVITKQTINIAIVPEEGRIKLVIRINREVKNISGSKLTHAISSKFLAPKCEHQSPYAAGFTYLEVDGQPINYQTILGNTEYGEELTHSIEISPDESASVGSSCYMVMDENDYCPFIAKVPTDKLTVNVQCPVDFSVKVQALHSVDMKEECRSACPELNRTWRLNAGCFPGNGVIVSWRRRPLALQSASQVDELAKK